MAERAGDRLVRLLGIISFLDADGAQPLVSLDELAAQFDVTPAQIRKDIDQLWVTGTPGYFPDDLIDFNVDFDAGVVSLTQGRGLTPPLRLGTREGVALTAALRAMSEVLGDSLDPERAALLESALDKLSRATGEAAQALDVRLSTASPDVGRATAATIGRALKEGKQLRIRYVNAADVVSERVVEPIQLRTGDAATYLVAWCLAADDERTFRMDRVLDASLLPTDATKRRPPEEFVPFAPASSSEAVRIIFDSPARWFAEQVPVEEVEDLDDGAFQVTLRVGDPVWLRHVLLQNSENVRSVDSRRVLDDLHAAADSALAAYGPDNH